MHTSSSRPVESQEVGGKVQALARNSGLRRSVAAHIPHEWEQLSHQIDVPCRIHAEVDVVLVVEDDLFSEWFRRIQRVLRATQSEVPWVLCTDPAPGALRQLLQTPPTALLFLGSEEGQLADLLKEILVRRPLDELASQINQMIEIPWGIRCGLAYACRCRPASVSDMVERGASGERSLCRFVSDLASLVGCSASHLYRAASGANISLGRCLRWITFIQVLSIRATGVSWEQIAFALGYSSTAGLSNFIIRLTGLPPTVAEVVGRGEWERRLIRELEGGSKLARKGHRANRDPSW
jgi:AraC-like DNA-binding protein